MPYKDKEVQKEKNKIYQKKYYEKNKNYYITKAKEKQDFLKSYINRVKSIFGCKKCFEKRYWVLDFHHKYGKDFNLGSSYKKYSLNKIKEEIRKCDVLCANCHRDLHFQQKN